MDTIRFEISSFPWSRKKGKNMYSNNEELFAAAHIAFSTNALGVCTITLGMLVQAMGKTTTSSLQAKHKEMAQEALEGLIARGESEAGAKDDYRIIRPDCWKGEAKLAKLLHLPVEKAANSQKKTEGYVRLTAEEYIKILETARLKKADPVSFFCFYLYLCGWMRKMTKRKDGRWFGGWRTKDAVLQDLKISYSTYLKYRDALHEADLIYCLPGKTEVVPAMFALVNEREMWIAIEADYRGVKAASSSASMMDAAEDAMFRKGIGRVGRSVFYRMQQQEERKAKKSQRGGEQE